MSERNPRMVWLGLVYEQVCVGALQSSANLVAHVMAVRYVNGGMQAWPSQPELAEATALSPRTVRSALHELEACGLLGVERGVPGLTSGCVYTLLLVEPNGAGGSSGG